MNSGCALLLLTATLIPAMVADAQTPRVSPKPASTESRIAVPVKTVMLFSSGVGYFEHEGNVRGNGSTELRFKTSQINDVLKSLILQDLDGGRISAITYPSQDPISQTLRSFQVDITGNPNLADLLNQLRGAHVTVVSRTERASGVILGVEKRATSAANGPPVETPILNLLTGATIRSIELPDIRTLSLDDRTLQEELNRALLALSQARDQDKKPVDIRFAGSGERRLKIGYVVETPIWKTSYRLLLDSTVNRLQGFAIVENQTESDWNDVSLSLVSGRPLSFIMDLYQPLYATRPTVTQELFNGLKPPVYGAGIEVDAARKASAEEDFSGRGVRGGVAAGRELSAPVMNAPVARAPIDPFAQAVASAEKMGELFQYSVANVTLARQKSAMLPIIADTVKIERLSIYNATVLRSHPLNGVRMHNTTSKHLLQGPVTVLDRGRYAGDARVDNVPPGQQRLLSYGIDLETQIDDTKNSFNSSIGTARIDRGRLIISRKSIASREYIADNKSDRNKVLVVEHPVRPGWNVVGEAKPVETTAAVYRFQIPLPSNRVTSLTVREERVDQEIIAMMSAANPQIVAYANNGEVPAEVREAIRIAARMKAEITAIEGQIESRTRQIAEISEEQNRIRENMKTVGQSNDYYQRLLEKLNEQESTIERLQRDRAYLQAQRDEKQRELQSYLDNLTVGRE